jgi:hypothetical protein
LSRVFTSLLNFSAEDVMRVLFLPLLTATWLLSAGPGQAQQRPAAAPDSVARPAAPAATDVIVRTNGDELPGRVLTITPQLVRYVPAAAPTADSLLAGAADTLGLAATDVFMIRYANGTKEVLRPTPEAAPAPGATLLGLSAAQRIERGRLDSRLYYKPAKGVFWGTFASTLVSAQVFGAAGLVVGAATSLTPPPRYTLDAPEPGLLDDPAYYEGYRKQAQNRKLGKAAAGYGVGLGSALALAFITVLVIFSAWH